MQTLCVLVSVAGFAFGSTGMCRLVAQGSGGWVHEAASWAACATAICGAFLFLAGMIWKTSRERTKIHGEINMLMAELRATLARLKRIDREVSDKLDVLFQKADKAAEALTEIQVRTTTVETQCRERSNMYQLGLEALQDAKELYEAKLRQGKVDG